MKCPKCGYTSFDYLDSCKKCNNALGDFKAKYGLRSLLFPHRTQQVNLPAVPALAVAATPVLAAADNDSSTDFGYDFDSEPAVSVAAPKAPAPVATDNFDFDTDWDAPAAEGKPAPQPAAADDPFDFMADPAPEAITEDDSFDFLADAAEPAPKVAAAGAEFDLDLGSDPAPTPALAEENAFEFEEDWDAGTAGEAIAVEANPAEDAIPEFAAEGFDFTDSRADEAVSFNDEFDFSDAEFPDLLSGEDTSPTAKPKLGAKEGPSDPFDQREPVPAGPAPAAASSPADRLEDQPAPAAEALERTDPAPLPEQLAVLAEAQPSADTEEFPAPPTTDLDQDFLPELSHPASGALAAPAGAGPAGTPFFRLGAGTFDLLLLALIYGLFLVAGKLALFPADQAMAALPLEALADLAIPYFLILFALCFGYFTLFHFLSGQTPGKMIFRLKVESAAGTPIDLAQAFLRSVGGLICLLCAGIGFLAILRAPEHRSWSDRLAGTRVIATTLPAQQRG